MQAPAHEQSCSPDSGTTVEQEDTPILLFMCCHPALTHLGDRATLRASVA